LTYFLFFLARSRLGGWLIRKGLKHMNFAIPVQRLRETETLLAFNHPKPSYRVHILIVSRSGYRTLMDIPLEDSAFQHDLFETVQSLVHEFGLETTGYRLVVNGGSYQDVPVLHFHLISM
jgi:histidine triad (HIT) family protein